MPGLLEWVAMSESSLERRGVPGIGKCSETAGAMLSGAVGR